MVTIELIGEKTVLPHVQTMGSGELPIPAVRPEPYFLLDLKCSSRKLFNQKVKDLDLLQV